MVVIARGCIRYLADWESCVRIVAFTMYMAFMVFSIWISRDYFYLVVYKLASVFWLMVMNPDERNCFIHLVIKRRKRKLVIFCSNTCRREAELKDGKPKPEFTGGIGVTSIIRAAEKYGGEYDFQNENGVFVFCLVMNIEPREKM